MNEQIGNKINDKTYIPLPPFKGFVLENFPFIEADFDAITNYQLLCKVIEELNNVISNQNTVQELGTDLVNAYNALIDAVNLAINEFETNITGDFNNLKNYVDNYFDNNFPELVSDKLDEMASNGTLQNLLNNYANIIKTYNTYSDLINDVTTFVNGLRVQTLGYYTIGDGGKAEYLVNNVSSGGIDLDNGLYLHLLIKDSVNIKQLGAYGDDSHDDTLVIQNAINDYNNIYIPKGVYKITNEINVSSYKYIHGDGSLSVLKSYFSYVDTIKYILISSSESNSVSKLIIEKLQFESDSANTLSGGIYIEYSTRGIVLNDLWFNAISNNIKLGNKTWGVTSLKNIYCLYLPSEITSSSIGIEVLGNTTYGDNIEVIGMYKKGLYLNTANVSSFKNLNISGSGDEYIMENSITIYDSKDISIDSGWFEKITDSLGDINTKNIEVIDSSNISIKNCHLSLGSIYIDNSVNVNLSNNKYYRNSAGLRYNNNSVIYADTISLGYVNYQDNLKFMTGKVKVIDKDNESSQNLLNNPLMFNGMPGLLTKTNNSLVTSTSDTTNFYSGDRSVQYAITDNNQGARLTTSSLLNENLVYTFIAIVRGITNIDKIRIASNGISNVSYYPNSYLKVADTNWTIIKFTGKVTSDTNRIDIVATRTDTSQSGVFAVDSVFIIDGIHDETIPTTLVKKGFMKNNKLYSSYSPSSGTWQKGDIVYNDFTDNTTDLCWIYNGTQWVSKTL